MIKLHNLILENQIPDEMIDAANKTSRHSARVGMNAVVPRAIEMIANKNNTILDYGAGSKAIHTNILKQKGFNVTAYDFGNNVDDKLHSKNALDMKYDIVYASNVLNVQGSDSMLRHTLSQIRNAMNPSGIFIFNLPKSPRYGAYSKFPTPKEQLKYLISTIREIFEPKDIQTIHTQLHINTPIYKVSI